MTKTKTGKPIIKYKGLELVFSNLDNSLETFDRILVMPSKESEMKQVVVKLDLKGIPIKILSVKERNKLAKIFKKFGKSINISDIETLEKDLNENLILRMNLLIM